MTYSHITKSNLKDILLFKKKYKISFMHMESFMFPISMLNTVYNVVVSTLPGDGLAPSGFKPSAGTV